MKLFFCPCGGFKECLLVVRTARCGPLLAAGQGNICSVSQDPQRFGEIDPLAFHNEAEDIAANVTNPALPRLPLRIHLQAGLCIIVPGADPSIVLSRTAQTDRTTH